MPEITVNGVKMTGRDYVAVGGGLTTLAGLFAAGLPWAMIGIGIAAIAASRLSWQSSTDSVSPDNPAAPKPPGAAGGA